ncbi:thioester reductase domain-containing protein [Saccharothrix lopnurensis]|uniref:Thioester reductase domain-containing protein n=1 Tax=Saccharothrix lopnurensis TaxID=1670621 RepID=A0ABW1P9T5_9PSEU
MSDTDIAVVGIGARFPDAWTPQDFWRNLEDGVVSLRELPREAMLAAGVTEAMLGEPDFVRVGTSLPGHADFAAEFFGYPPTEAELIDPQQRVFLEASWEALETAGHAPRPGGPVVGVFAGGAQSTYTSVLFAAKAQAEGMAAAIDDVDLHLGGLGDFLPSRVAYKLGLRGPTVGVQTACSSSLYAVHYATLSLLSGECDIALAGGATVLEPIAGYRYQPGGLMSADGFCRAFDARSTGTSFSSGVGVVALRRLSDALADGDHVLAVVKGSAVGNDGADRSGFTAPNPLGVAEVVSGALRVAGVGADELRYVEAHGSGTSLGDHIELRGLAEGLRASTSRTGFCSLGTVKANIGHTGPAAGIAGFIKAVRIAQTGTLPAHPMFERPRDPGLLAESPFHIATETGATTDRDRHVLVNSMGLGGTNVAAVLAPPPAPTRPAARADEVVRLVLSARTRTELDAMSKRLADALDPDAAADVAHTLRVGRKAFPERRVVSAPAGRLAAALRLPGPPAARTVRATPRRALIDAAEGVEQAVLDRFALAFGADVEVVAGPEDNPPPNTHVVSAPGDVDEAITDAWLHGVEVDWAALSDGTGRRVPLPAYPLSRRRAWALDRYPALHATPAPACAAVPAAPSTEPVVGADDVEQGLLEVWRDLFGGGRVGLDDEFGALGGSSLLSVQMVLKIQKRFDVLVNVHRAGGSKATVRRIAEIVRGLRAGAERGSSDIDPIADGDGDLVDRDLQLPLGELAPFEAPGRDVLLTGTTGFLGTFLLHELLAVTEGRVYCVVRADDEARARQRLRDASAKFGLPEPDPARVHLVLGDLRDVTGLLESYRDGELAGRIGYVLHCAAKVVFTEPYRVLREDNVLATVDLLRWMRGHGIRDFSFVSTVAATHYALGTDNKILETRDQPLDPQQGGYGVGKWVAERLLERAEQDGMRVRIFRPGFILGSTKTGACNDKDLIWNVLTSGLAVGAHPLDDRAMPMAPVDVVSRAMAELTVSPGSVGRVYHLVDRKSFSPRRLFGLLAGAGWRTEAVTPETWQRRVADKALETGSGLLSTMALYELDGHELDEDGLEAVAWRPWLERAELGSAPTGDLLRRCLTFLAERHPKFGDLIGDLLVRSDVDDQDLVEVR